MASGKPLISIIIPVKGRLDITSETIQSIYNQDYDLQKVEILIVEERDYGEYISPELKKRFPSILAYLNEDEKYSGGSRNTGVKVAKGKYIVFLDSDDKMDKNYLKFMWNEIVKDSNCGAVVCLSYSSFDPKYGLKLKIILRPLMWIRDLSIITAYFFNKKYIYPSSFYLCQISHMIFRREIVANLEFNAKYRYGGEDWDYFRRALEIAPIRILPKRLLSFRYIVGSSTDNPINRKRKWKSYQELASCLPINFKRSIFFILFLLYIFVFGYKNTHA